MKTPAQETRYAALAARALARGAEEDGAAAGVLLDRPAALQAIERALQARRRRRFVPWLAASVAAAAAIVLAFAWHGSPGPVVAARRRPPVSPVAAPAVTAIESESASIESTAGVRLASTGERIAPGSTVSVAGAGRALLALDTGTQLQIGGSSRARVTALGSLQRFDLEAGTLEAHVAKLVPGDRFLIATADTEVEVKGTRFQVAWAAEASSCAPYVRTRVVVHEGVVAVRFAGGEVHVAAGSAWPACAPAAPLPAAPPSPARASHRHPARPAVAAAAPAPVPAPAPALDPSTLAEQNGLFAAALAARRRGDAGEAVRWLDRLISRHPEGQLADSARAERRRLLDQGEESPTAP
jgi:ferric-dicitrate binding protein FerR (iron transport regulator)